MCGAIMQRLRGFLDKRKLKGSRKQSSQSQPTQPTPEVGAMPVEHGEAAQKPLVSAGTPAVLSVALRNDTTSSAVFAYITGQALDHNNAIMLLQSDGRTPYYPTSPSAPGSRLAANCAIPLGAPGNTVVANIPHIAGGRIWFSIGGPLTFLINPGPALVEPSVTNPSDPNHNVNWSFCEFTYNNDQLYANISYVDFVGIPISLNLTTHNSGTQHVSGMPTNGLQQIADGLRAQAKADGHPWDSLIVNQANGQPLRVLSPNQGMVGNANFLANYFDGFVSQVLTKYQNDKLSVDTQAGFGVVTSSKSNPNALVVGDETFSRPSTRDIFGCSTGPFATGSDAKRNAIIPRLAAAFNRSTLLETNRIPAQLNLYYKNPITNHYSRVVHAANLDGKGYAFPYDDVQPTGGADQSGEVHAGDPLLWTVAVGGSKASKA